MKCILKYFLLLAIVLTSCQKILFNDEQEFRQIPLGKFNAALIKGIYNIVLVQDSTDKLVITGRNRVSRIDARVVNDTLTIDNNTFTLDPSRNNLELHFSTLKYLITYHPVSITVKDTIRSDFFNYTAIGEIEEADLAVRCDYLIIFGGHNTLGNFHISGKTYFADLSVRYGASMDARKLICTKAEVYNSSAGDIYVNATDQIKAYLNGTGNIYYYGNPRIDIPEKNGEGKMIPLN